MAMRSTILILGDFLHEGIETSITTLGFTYEKLTLHDRLPRTWLKRVAAIDDYLQAGRLAAVIVYLPTPVLLHGCTPDFDEAWHALIERLEKTNSIIFIYEDNLVGEFYYISQDSAERLPLKQAEALLRSRERKEKDVYEYDPLVLAVANMRKAKTYQSNIDSLLKRLLTSRIEVSPFRKRSDVTLRIEEFLTDVDCGTFLRLYVPSRRWQADQIVSFLNVFERYLNQVEGWSFAVNSQKTEGGVLYIFRAKEKDVYKHEFEQSVGRFDAFMTLCRDEPSKAEAKLDELGLDSDEASYAVMTYARQYQRILLDARHEIEYKIMRLRQRFEADVLESTAKMFEPHLNNNGPAALLSFVGNSGIVNINFGKGNTSVSGEVQNEIVQTINGGIVYNDNDKKLFELLQFFAERLEAFQLKSDLDQLKDHSVPETNRESARKRITTFLIKVGAQTRDRAIEIGVKALVAYVEQLARGSA